MKRTASYAAFIRHKAKEMDELMLERTGYVGWVEFVRDGGSTTHIAYLYEDGSIYFPEGPQVASEWDLRASEAAGRMWPLVRSQWDDSKSSHLT